MFCEQIVYIQPLLRKLCPLQPDYGICGEPPTEPGALGDAAVRFGSVLVTYKQPLYQALHKSECYRSIQDAHLYMVS